LDKLQRGRRILLGIEQWIFRERSEFQEVAVARVPDFGKGLFLDAVVEFLEIDEFVYHEHAALPPLLFHPSPKRVLIAGGGDGLVLREVLRDPRVEEVVMVEIDGLVIDACKEHLKELHRGSFDDPRARVLVQDVFPYLESSTEPFEVILIDLLDAYDADAVRLYENVLGLARRALTPGGVLGAFGDLAIPRMSITPVHRALTKRFERVALHRADVPTFSGGYGFLLASDRVDFAATATDTILERAQSLSGDLRALTPRAFPGCFAVPGYLAEALDGAALAPSSSVADAFTWLE
jgi:spermidine synthase